MKLKANKKKYLKITLIICLFFGLLVFVNTTRQAPQNTSLVYPWRNCNVTFLKDNSGPSTEKEIMEAQLELIAKAEKYIIIDAFLFNSHRGLDKNDYPQICQELTNALVKRQKDKPNLRIIFITDPINTFYGSYITEEMKLLKDNGIKLIETDLTKLRDPNPLWSALWRPFLSPLGVGKGWLSNPIAPSAPKVSLRAFLTMFNLKANHRKTITTEQGSIITSANPHDASFPNGNSGVLITGATCVDIAESELNVANFSGGLTKNELSSIQHELSYVSSAGNIRSRLVIDGAIASTAIDLINSCKEKDQIDLAMFYFSDERIIKAIKLAASRNAKIRIILDRNIAAFGRKKGTIPNSVTAQRLIKSGGNNIAIRWAKDENGEQFHHKMLLITKDKNIDLLIGSGNYTRRNIAGYNLESDVQISGKRDDDFAISATEWFENEWVENSTSWKPSDAPSLPLSILSRFQETTGLCSF